MDRKNSFLPGGCGIDPVQGMLRKSIN